MRLQEHSSSTRTVFAQQQVVLSIEPPPRRHLRAQTWSETGGQSTRGPENTDKENLRDFGPGVGFEPFLRAQTWMYTKRSRADRQTRREPSTTPRRRQQTAGDGESHQGPLRRWITEASMTAIVLRASDEALGRQALGRRNASLVDQKRSRHSVSNPPRTRSRRHQSR